jgi:hypothetical protein
MQNVFFVPLKLFWGVGKGMLTGDGLPSLPQLIHEDIALLT